MQSNLSTLWFSQASLSSWLSCPLKFKFRYIDGLYWPMSGGNEVSQHIELGRKFHLLAEYYFRTGSADVPSDCDPLLKQWLASLKDYLPLSGGARFLPEYELRSARNGIRLLAKYDLLAVGQGGVTIYDWKTDGKAPRPSLAGSAQTRLYLYLLSLTDYFVNLPGGMRMVYWNPRFPREPLLVQYSQEQRTEDGKWLEKLIAQVQDSAAFPATNNEKNCRFCEYRPVCHGQGLEEVDEAGADWDEVDWDQVQELALQGVNHP